VVGISSKQIEISGILGDWEVVKLGDILTLEYGKGLPENERSKGDYPVFGSNGIVGYHEQFLVKGPGIVVGRKGTIGVVTWVDSDFWPIDTTYFVKTKNENVFLKWLFFKLKQSNLPRLSQSDVVPGLKRELVYHITISLPPLSEQRRIAEVLGTVDSAIQKVGGAIESTERLKKGLMQRLLTKGIGHDRFKESEVGRIPEEWGAMRLGDVLELCQYGLSVKMDETGKYPIIKMDDIVNGVVVPDKVKYIDLDENTFNNFKLEKGDILFNRTNSYELVGRTGIFLLRGDYVFASYLIRLKPKKEIIDSHFLTFYMVFSNNKIRQQLATRAVHQANINATNLQNFQIPLPPLPEQRRIAEILSAADKKLELERRRKEKLSRVKKGLMNDLLTGNKRVNIEVM